MTLETERLILRPLSKADAPAVQLWASVPENVKYMVFGPNTENDTLAFLEACEKSAAADPVKNYDFGIILKETGDSVACELIGSCGIYQDDERKTGVLGWIIRRDYWKRGIMTEVARELIRYGFEELGLHRITADCIAENYGSWKVMEHNNMRREGHYIKSRRLRNVTPDQWVDVYYYAILEEEYFNA